MNLPHGMTVSLIALSLLTACGPSKRERELAEELSRARAQVELANRIATEPTQSEANALNAMHSIVERAIQRAERCELPPLIGLAETLKSDNGKKIGQGIFALAEKTVQFVEKVEIEEKAAEEARLQRKRQVNNEADIERLIQEEISAWASSKRGAQQERERVKRELESSQAAREKHKGQVFEAQTAHQVQLAILIQLRTSFIAENEELKKRIVEYAAAIR